MSKTYFVSDLHFGHFNILKYEPCRVDAIVDWVIEKGYYANKQDAYDSFERALSYPSEKYQWLFFHDEMLIDRWNSVVKDDDVVWFLGDLGFSKDIGRDGIKEAARRLKGNIKMVYGNHDREKPEFYYSCGFKEVCVRPTLLKGWFLLSHAPSPYINEHTPFYNIYGHVHSHESFKTRAENTMCVCVERHNFTPTTVPEFDAFVEEEFTNPAKERQQ